MLPSEEVISFRCITLKKFLLFLYYAICSVLFSISSPKHAYYSS